MTADNNLFLDILSAWLPKEDPFKQSLSLGTIILENGKSYSGPFAVACYVSHLRKWPLVGKDELEKIQIQDFVLDTLASDIRWEALSNNLKNKTFMVGAGFSLADIALFSKIYHPFSRLNFDDRMVYYHVTRYFDLIQHLVADNYMDDILTRIIDIDLDAEIKVSD